jgi:hypothetical protein
MMEVEREMDMNNYEHKLLQRAYKAINEVTDFLPKVSELEKILCDAGWASQLMSYQVFREEGVFELYHSSEKLYGKSVSDRLADAFYQSSTLDEFYTELNIILLEREMGDE